jgi:hypothetical protein
MVMENTKSEYAVTKNIQLQPSLDFLQETGMGISPFTPM